MTERMRHGFKALVFLALLACAVWVCAGCRDRTDPEPGPAAANSYIGSAKCKLCHGPYKPAAIHGTYHEDWLNSAHGKAAAVVPSDATVVADVNDNGTDDFMESLDLNIMPGWSQYTTAGGASADVAPLLSYSAATGAYFVTIGGRTFTVERVMGTGREKQAYVTVMGNSRYVLPLLYLVESREWVPLAPENWYTWTDTNTDGILDPGETVTGVLYPTPAESPVTEGRTGDSWERRCAGCHVTAPISVTSNAQGEYVVSYKEEGIACEACHGPGLLHAATLGGRGYPGRAIVNPSKLAASLRNDICMSCHSAGVSAATVGTSTLDYPRRADGTLFIPGQELTEAFTLGLKQREEIHAFQGNLLHRGETGSKYGSWSTACLQCHGAHDTANLFRVRTVISTPASGDRAVLFTAVSGTAGTTGLMGDATDGAYDNICEVCHTRTTYFRNNPSTPDTGHFNGRKCSNCHRHERGFLKPEGRGGTDCSSCHTYLTSRMTVTMPAYTHFLGDTAAVYPTVASSRNCLSCHADHDLFNPTIGGAGRGANLREDIATPPVPASGFTNTDFVNSGNGGACLSCHASTHAKSYARPDGSTQLPAIPYAGAIADQLAAYDASPHGGGYTVQAEYRGTSTNTFDANCTKCHNDDLQPKSGVSAQTGNYKFGLHLSTRSAMLGPLGLPAGSDPLEEKFCYRCHSTTTDATGGTRKTVASRDWYDAASMSARAEGIFAAQSAAYGHRPGSYSGLHSAVEGGSYNWNPAANRHVECADCHNPHAAGPARSFDTSGLFAQPSTVSNLADQTPLAGIWGVDVPAWPAAWMTPDPATAYSRLQPAQYTWQVCLKCHSGYAYGATSPAGQTDVAREFNPNNPSYHAVIGASKTTYPPNTSFVGPWTKTSALNCSDCHTSNVKTGPQGPHGSAYGHILAAQFDTSTGNAGTQGHLCFKCHSFNVYGEGGTAGASATGFSRGGINRHTSHMAKDKPGAGRKVTCVDCHSALPHGFSRRAMLVTSSDPAPYNKGDAANSATDASSWPSSGNWRKSDCNNAACH